MRTFRRGAVAVAALAIVGCTSGTASPQTASRSTAPARAVAVIAADWPMYHGNRARTGYSTTMPAFTNHLALTRKIALDGAVYGSPIVVGGRIVVATENDTVYAFTLAGAQIWRRHLGSPSPAS